MSVTAPGVSIAPPQVRVRRWPGAPVVSVRVWLPGGVRSESTPGQALIAGRMLAEGTNRRDWRRISEEAEALGCSIVTTAGYSVQGIALDGVARHWQQLVAWAVELICEARFPEQRCAWLCEQAVAELEGLADMPEVVTGWAFLKQLYRDHPLGRPLQGSIESLSSLAASDCVSMHRSCLERGPLIAVAGEIDPEVVSSRVSELTEHMNGSSAVAVALDDPQDPSESTVRVELPPGEQAHVQVGGLTVRRTDDDFDATRILGVVLGAGNGLTGRIPQRVREVEGLAYGCDIDAVSGAGIDRGRLIVSLATAVSNVDGARAAVREELTRVYEHGVSEEEVEAARAYLLGREPFQRETARQRALLDLESMHWDLPVDDAEWTRMRLEGVQTDDVQRAARRYLAPAQLVETIGVPV